MEHIKKQNFDILEYLVNPIIILSLDYVIVDINQPALRIYAWQKLEVLGKKLTDILGENEPENPIIEWLFSHKNQPAAGNVLTTISNQDDEITISWSISSLANASPPFQGIILTGNNLTLQKKLENKVYELDSIIAQMPGNVYWYDTDHKYLGCNQNSAKTLGMSREETLGKNFVTLMKSVKGISDVSINQWVQDGIEVMQTGIAKLNILEDPFIGPDDKIIYTLTNKVPLFDKTGKLCGVVGISTDISKQKEIEQDLKAAKEKAEAASLAKSEFLANMSHDVKTPLAGIVGLADILRRSISDEYRQMAQEVMEAGQHVMRFFENCIELSRLENNDIDLSEEEFSLKEVVYEIFKLFLPSTKAKGLNLRIEYADNIPSRLLGSRINIYRTILNLIGNAIKFTARGAITIRVKAMASSDPKKVMIKLVVADTGIGIPANKKDVIFERFSRVAPSHQGTYEGSGIGLYIVHKFVTATGGSIKIKSRIDKGSLFQIILPLRVASCTKEIDNIDFSCDDMQIQPSISLPEKPAIVKQDENSPAYVLLVEDNVMAQKGAKAILESLSCKVDIAGSGREAIGLFYPGKYDLIFMDIGLPDIKGYDVAKRMRTMEQNTDKYTPILGLSAHAQLEEKKLSIDSGIDQMLSKPLLFDQAQELLKYYTHDDKTVVPSELCIDDLVKMPLVREIKTFKAIDLQKGLNDGNSADRRFSLQMLYKLVESLPESLKEIDEAYRNQRMGTLQSAIHKLHGGLCYTPTPQLLHAAAELDGCLKNGEYKKVDDLYKEFLNAVTSFEKTYELLADLKDLIGII